MHCRAMKSNTKGRKSQKDDAAFAIQNSSLDIPTQCPTVHQLIETGEFNLLDVMRIQTEVERLLAATTQRMTCISHKLRGLPIPVPVARNLGLMEPDPHNRPQHPAETASTSTGSTAKVELSGEESTPALVVTANPEKPLSLIITSQKHQPQSHLREHHNEATSQAPKSTSGAVSPAASPHDIPNRFWALMEPYCADITESNVAYLEGILKSYVEEATVSKYFHLLPLKSLKSSESATSKRPKRDSHNSTETSADTSRISEAFKSASRMVSLARQVDSQLSEIKPTSSPHVENLLQSMESDLYEENVSSVLRNAVASLAHSFAADEASVTSTSGKRPTEGQSSGGGSELTSVCSQPLKNLARQLQVSSSFRVEKKISQAAEELGLFPLTLYLHQLSHQPARPLIRLPDYLNTDATPLLTTFGPPSHTQQSVSDMDIGVTNGSDNQNPSSPSQQDHSETVVGESEHKSQTNGGSHVLQKSTVVASDSSSGEETAEAAAESPLSATEDEEEKTSPANGGNGGNGDPTDDGAETSPPSSSLSAANPAMPASTAGSEESSTPNSASETEKKHNGPLDNNVSLISKIEDGDKFNEPIVSKHEEGPISLSPHHSAAASVVTNGNGIENGDGGGGGGVETEDSATYEWFHDGLIHLRDIPATVTTSDVDEDLSSCLLNLTAGAAGAGSAAANTSLTEATSSGSVDQLTLALMRRQRELRLVCAANHNILHRLVQAARRDLQRQEIQRRLAIADADVTEAYNKLESYKAQKRTALKRDRDYAWKALKERQKIRAELDAFDRKPP